MTVAMFAVASAQERTVTGQVVYAGDGEPLVGASVLPIGGGVGCSTDIDGNFTLKVGANVKRLKVSYVGMKTAEVDITSGKMLIKLDDAENRLDEVMVVAYGTATKEAFTGSAAVIDASQIESRRSATRSTPLTRKWPACSSPTLQELPAPPHPLSVSVVSLRSTPATRRS